ncbi:hypothetical protein [Kiloniella sp. b19]|uniref:hypothetical protein n=1 Tax=Kiloniella sp. GXU_MW_B19 TaxID=3141326 RepID=UPI0031D723FE
MKAQHLLRHAGMTALLFLLSPAPVLAADQETSLSGQAIQELLTGNTASNRPGDSFVHQTFEASGRTVYRQGERPTEIGKWRVEGDQYCSQWPPFGGWSCYRMTSEPFGTLKTGDTIRATFVGQSTEYPVLIRIKGS